MGPLITKGKVILVGGVVAGLVATAPLWYGSGGKCPVAGGGHSRFSAQALPNWSKKYNQDCTFCHTSWGRLNRTGYRFRLLGYRMPYEMDDKTEPSPLKPKGRTYTDKEVYLSACDACHPQGGKFSINSRPLKGEKFLAKFGDDSALANVIRNGIPSTAMPPFSEERLPDEALRAVIRHIRTLSPGSAKAQPSPTATISGPRSGQEVYKASCEGCHPGGGNVFVSSKLLKGPGFSSKFPDESSLTKAIREGTKGTAMPPYSEQQISNDEMKSLVDYIRSFK